MPTVVHVVRKFEPREWGGIETHLVALVPELSRLGWRSEVHAPAEEGTDGAALRAAGAELRTFRARYPVLGMDREDRARLVRCGGNLVSADELIALLRDRSAVLHAHALGRLGGVVRAAARARRVPYAVTLHGPVRTAGAALATPSVRGFDLGAPFGWAVGARRVVHDADLVFVPNRSERDAWVEDRTGKHLELAPLGVDASRASAGARRDAAALLGPGGPYVCVLGRVDGVKGQDLALKAFSRGAPPSWRLVFAGSFVDSGLGAELLAAAERDPRIVVLGGVAPAIARALLADAALALVPSRAEPFGLTLLEAWAEGTPALFSDVDGLADIARRCSATEGAVIRPTVAAWEDALRFAISTASFRERESSQGPSRVAAHFTWRALAERIVAGYEAARRPRSSRSPVGAGAGA